MSSSEFTPIMYEERTTTNTLNIRVQTGSEGYYPVTSPVAAPATMGVRGSPLHKTEHQVGEEPNAHRDYLVETRALHTQCNRESTRLQQHAPNQCTKVGTGLQTISLSIPRPRSGRRLRKLHPSRGLPHRGT